MPAIQPRASTRVSIQWQDDPPIEETETLVLTFPTHYLDLRVYLAGHPQHGHIQWAQAGDVKLIHAADAADDDNHAAAANLPSLEFIPRINSVPPPPSHIPKLADQASFETLPNGDVQEFGSMFNPDRMRNESYIEVWRRMGLRSLHDDDDGGGGGGHVPALRVEQQSFSSSQDATAVHAFIGHIGQFALGIARIEAPERDRFIAWREAYDFESRGWRRVVSVGQDEELVRYVPSIARFLSRADASRQGTGLSLDGEGEEWTVLYASE
ncbi:hypothetical protein NliqN6_6229 [Naganishia liquefaciens]|uniref:Protein HRI1 n=1 Tax=Naganishia liquefaciens TaxID=104408 RepID=A0A8H3TZ72_9TREE|nr:hypothetical protein NliqN6_6229 [Naganishia liquefaciens]